MRLSKPSRTLNATSDRAMATTLIAGMLLLLVVGLVFSVAYGSRQITAEASALHNADESLRAATVLRAQAALAVHASAVDREFGTNSEMLITNALAEIGVARSDLQQGISLLASDGEITRDAQRVATEYIAILDEIADRLAEGDSISAQQVSQDELPSSFDDLRVALVDLRNDLAKRVAASDLLLGRIGNSARLLVALVIPVAVILVYRDLVRRQQRQADLESRLAAQRELSAAREEFIANASHELRTPLTGIKGMALLLEEEPQLRSSDTAAELVDLIISSSEDLSRMVEDLLTAARLDAGALTFTYENVWACHEIDEVVGPLVRNGLNIVTDCSSGLIHVDKGRFRQVLRNLISNSVKYGGPNIEIVGRTDERTYVCQIIDDGDGIPAELHGRLFERFIHQGHQTATKDSVGLGLSIVRALVDGMGGAIRYDRMDGKTVFSVRVPLAIEADEPHDVFVQAGVGRG